MNAHRVLLSALASMSLLAAVPAGAQEPVELNSTEDFSIKKERVPKGCTFFSMTYNPQVVEFACETEAAFDAGFIVSPKLVKKCVAEGSKVICSVRKL